ncbi:MAG: cadherin-like domain-containing protein, partial [Hyphomicrobiales bacterium]
ILAETSYTELAAPETLAPSLALVDVDNTTLVSATVKITDGLTAGDVLSVGGLTSGTDGGVTWSFDANSGVLSFSGEAAKATYAALLAQVGFASTSQDPTAMGANLDRTIHWQANDGLDVSAAVASTVIINAINDEPIVVAVDLGAIDEDTFRLITTAELLAGASDVDSPSLSISSLSIQSGNGELVDNHDGTWSFTPAENDNTEVTFAYSVTDGENAVSSTATLDLTPVNDRPSVRLDNFIVELPEDVSTAEHIKVADIVIIDDDQGTNILSLTGNDAFAFEIVGNELFLKAGTMLDFESKANYEVEVKVDDPTIVSNNVAAAPGKVSDTLHVGNVSPETIFGTPEKDTLHGGSDIDFIYGQAGNDTLYGDDGNDFLDGSSGKDRLFGGDGDDTLVGGRGRDILEGNGGADSFDFNSIKDSKRDTILDFERGQDEIDLSTIDAKKGGGNQKFKWIGKSDFHGKKGELHYIDKGSKVIVQGDVNGDGKADFQIFLKVGALDKGDFLL